MVTFIEYLGIPGTIGVVIVALFFALQIVGEILEFKGKVVPEILKVRKYFARKETERKTLQALPETMKELKDDMAKIDKLQTSVDSLLSHYAVDNIHKRDDWIATVNKHLEDSDCQFTELGTTVGHMEETVEKNKAMTVKILTENMRKEIIDFASFVSDEKHLVTREKFRRIFKLYEEYEAFIKENGLTNGEIEISYKIINESYEEHLRNHTFIEDLKGYNK